MIIRIHRKIWNSVILVICLQHQLCFSLSLSLSSQLIRLASWNLLAPVYTKGRKYPWCSEEHLSWDHRKGLITEQLIQARADILCLQEVQIEHWPDLLASLQPLRYQGILQNVTSGHPVATAVLYDASKLELLRSESRSRALIAVLKERSSEESSSSTNINMNTDRHLYLASVHLEAGQEEDCNLTRYHQLKSLWKRMSNHIRLDKVPLDDAAVVLAGDFNMLYSNPLYSSLSRGLLYHPNNPLTPAKKLTKLEDAYRATTSIASPKRLEKTFGGGSILDYIWTSERVDVKECLVLNPQVLDPERQLCPSDTHPSDHLPIGAVFQWR